MLMDERMDAGPILAQRVYPILEQDTAAALGDRLADAGATLLVETLSALVAGEIRPIAQDESLATYCKQLRKEDADIDWSRRAVEIVRDCRAQTPWPGCQSDWKGRQVRFLAVEAIPGQSSLPPGSVYTATALPSGEPFVAVATGDGALVIHELQLPGKRPLRVSDFVRGQPDFLGSRLGGGADLR
jgi:methionyl-tRNA formyltransferase